MCSYSNKGTKEVIFHEIQLQKLIKYLKSQHTTFLIKFDKSQQTLLKIDLYRAVITEIKEKGEIDVKSKNMMITNEIAEITIKRYTKFVKSIEKLNSKFSQVIDEIEIKSKNYYLLYLKKFLRSASLKFDGN